MKKIILIISLLIFTYLLTATNLPPVASPGEYESGKIYVKMKNGIRPETSSRSFLAKIKFFEISAWPAAFFVPPNLVGGDELKKIYEFRFSLHRDPQIVADAFNSDPEVEYAERIPMVKSYDIPNDSLYAGMSHLRQVQAEDAWDIFKGEDAAEEIIIAIVDSGVDWTHPDLIDNYWKNLGEDIDGDGSTVVFDGTNWVLDIDDINGIDDDENGYIDDLIGWNFTGATALDKIMIADPSGHGTHCAGLASATTNNNLGVASVAWNVTVMGTQHDADGGNAYEANVYNGILYAARNGADIINCSWGANYYSRTHQEVIDVARQNGSYIVASAGNENNDEDHYPSAYQGVISVASVAVSDERAYYSCFGPSVDIASPGGDYYAGGTLLSTEPGGMYQRMQGTSMAGPVYCSVAALLMAYRPDFNHLQLASHLAGTAINIDDENPNYINKLGGGRVDAYEALSTNSINLPQLIKPALFSAGASDGLSVDSAGSISFALRNYANNPGGEVTFQLTSTSDGVNVTNDQFTAYVYPDSLQEFNDVFTIDIAAEATFLAEFTLSLFSIDVPITVDTFTFDIPIKNGPSILIWEHTGGSQHMSGSMFNNALATLSMNNGYVDYRTGENFPVSLNNYDAVFLCFGNESDYPYYANPPNFDDYIGLMVQNYLAEGGRVYLEGNNVMHFQNNYHWGCDNPELISLLGIELVDNGEDNPINNLIGQAGTVAEGMTFERSSGLDIRSVDHFVPLADAQTVFYEADYGNVAVQYVNPAGGKSIVSSYAISGLRSEGDSSSLDLFLNILAYFDIPTIKHGFDMSATSGHAPLTVNFTSTATSFPPLSTWEWDFDNDTIWDASGSEVNYTYTQPGTYTITHRVAVGELTADISNSLRVFAGTSCLQVSDMEAIVRVEDSPRLSLTNNFSFSGWINPHSWGTQGSAGHGTFFSKDRFTCYLSNTDDRTCDNGLVVWMFGNGTPPSYCYTPDNTIILDQWQHIALVYDDVLRIYINGVEQDVTYTSPFSGDLNNRADTPVSFGTNYSTAWDYDGLIDNFAYWDRAITSNEILALSTGLAYDLNDHNLVALWMFNEGGGDIAYDIVGGNNGELVETIWMPGFVYDYVSTDDHTHVPAISQSTCYPNPYYYSNTATRASGINISFDLPKASRSTVRAYNIKGQMVKDFGEYHSQGTPVQLNWDASDKHGAVLASGVYFIRLNAAGFSQTQKVLIIK